MKKKIFRLSMFMILLSSLFGLSFGFFAMPKAKVSAAAADAMVSSYTLVDKDGKLIQHTEEVGKVTPEKSYALDEGAEVQAIANTGYELVKWRVFTGEESYVDFTTSETQEIVIGGTNVEVVGTFIDGNGDGRFESGSVTTDKTPADIKIVPVFDYSYYTINASNLKGVMDLTQHATKTDLYYAGSNSVGDEDVYTNAFIGDNYFGTVYEKGGEFYTKHDGYTIDVGRGAFRMNDTVDVLANVGASQNIDVKGVKFNSSNLTVSTAATLSNGTYKITKDSDDRTTSVAFNVKVLAGNNNIELVFDRLYTLSISVTIDGEVPTGFKVAEATAIRSKITANNYYKLKQDGTYFVKNLSGNTKFSLNCAQQYAVNGYVYYTFGSTKYGEEEKTTNLSEFNPNKDTNVVVNYVSKPYNINFSFALYEGDRVQVQSGDFAVLQTKSIVRGQTVTLTKDEAETIENLGYTFVGYATPGSNTVVADNYEVVLNQAAPIDKNVVMCFEKVQYNIQFVNQSGSDVALGETKPVKQVKVGNSTQTTDLSSAYTFTGVAYTINQTANIDVVLNDGFEMLGLKLSTSDADYLQNKSFVLTKDVLSKANGNVISVYVYAQCSEYLIEYKIEAVDSVFRANLWLEVPEYAVVKDASGATITNLTEDNLKTIKHFKVSNLKYNDQVKFYSRSIVVKEEGEQDLSYSFKMYTYNGLSPMVNVTPITGEGETVYCLTENVKTNNRIISVVYSVKLTSLQLALSEEFNSALNLENIQVAQNGSPITINNDKLYEIEAAKEVSVSVPAQSVAYGYILKGAVLNVNGVTLNASTDKLTYTFVPLNQENLNYVLTFTMDYVKFMFNIVDENDTAVGQVQLTIPSTEQGDIRNITFQKPEGMFVENVKVKQGDEWISYLFSSNATMNESNDTRFTDSEFKYSYDFTLDEFKNITAYATGAGEQKTVDLKVFYDYYKYTINVYQGLLESFNTAKEAEIQHPGFTLIYNQTGSGQAVPVESEYFAVDNRFEFKGIPYNSKIVTITKSSDHSAFMEFYAWMTYSSNSSESSVLDGSNLLSYSFENVKEDKSIRYVIKYKNYIIDVQAKDEFGAPNVEIAKVGNLNLENNSLVQGMNFTINSNADLGYKFKEMVYYTKYAYNDATWNNQEIYTYDSLLGYELVAADSVYDPTTTYYVANVVSDINNLKDIEFRIAKYTFVDGNVAKFFINYELRKLTVVNSSNNYDNGYYLNGVGSPTNPEYYINIPLSEYANYLVYATSTNPELTKEERDERLVNPGETVDKWDNVRIEIHVNSKALGKYDLNMGLALKDIYFKGDILTKSTFDGYQELRFNALDAMRKLTESEESFKFDYTYETQLKTISATTIIQDSEFYDIEENAGENGIKLSVYETYGFGGKTITTKEYVGYCGVESTLQFLATARLTYNLGRHAANFKVASIKVYSDGLPVSEDDYELYGIQFPADYKKGDNIPELMIQYKANIKIVYQVQPIIHVDGEELTKDKEFAREYTCDEDGFALVNDMLLTKGEYVLGSSRTYNISAASFIVNNMSIKFSADGKNYFDSVSQVLRDEDYNVISYKVKLIFSFANNSEYKWLNGFEIPYNITYLIIPKNIELVYTGDTNVRNIDYTGSSSYELQPDFFENLYYVGEGIRISYNKYLDQFETGKASFTTNPLQARTTYDSKGKREDGINYRNLAYDLCVEDIELAKTDFNNNFNLSNLNKMIRINNFVRRNKKELYIENIFVFDKVDDLTEFTSIDKEKDIKLTNKIVGLNDDVNVDVDRIVAKFIGYTKGYIGKASVNVNINDALYGEKSANYYVKDQVISNVVIYPYSRDIDIEGYGKITVYNEKGRTNPAYAILIPVDAKLVANVIEPESVEYVEMYDKISNVLSRTNVFGVGYKLNFDVLGSAVKLDNNLVLHLPKIDDLTDVAYLSSGKCDKLEYSEKDGLIVVDLSKIEGKVEYVFLTQRRAYMPLWAIILIVVGSLAVIAGIVVAVVIIRKKKLAGYSAMEKI